MARTFAFIGLFLGLTVGVGISIGSVCTDLAHNAQIRNADRIDAVMSMR